MKHYINLYKFLSELSAPPPFSPTSIFTLNRFAASLISSNSLALRTPPSTLLPEYILTHSITFAIAATSPRRGAAGAASSPRQPPPPSSSSSSSSPPRAFRKSAPSLAPAPPSHDAPWIVGARASGRGPLVGLQELPVGGLQVEQPQAVELVASRLELALHVPLGLLLRVDLVGGLGVTGGELVHALHEARDLLERRHFFLFRSESAVD
ncbi:uncharacterized protein J3R85_007310 [Psidium guajava]|nr:uncharacterized protein J3R85_007310 [Psidium guajava]